MSSGSTGRDYGFAISSFARTRKWYGKAIAHRRARLRARWTGRRYEDRADEVERFCLFVGFPRSGTTLAGQLLNAHRHVLIAHEADILRFIEEDSPTRGQVLSMIVATDRSFVADGAIGAGYDYAVPGQWQGRVEALRVVGDKRAGLAVTQLARNPALIDRVRTLMDVPLRVINVVRNPFDNITTIARRHPCSLERAVDLYFARVENVQVVERALGADEFLRVWSEELIADPPTRLVEMCRFLGIDAPADYLDACTSVVFSDPRRSREGGDWTGKLVDVVERRMADVDFLRGYSFDA